MYMMKFILLSSSISKLSILVNDDFSGKYDIETSLICAEKSSFENRFEKSIFLIM